jgi:DNA-binding transcriptional MocR family regulator
VIKLIQKELIGKGAAEIAASIEQLVASGVFEAGAQLPPVRKAAELLQVSPGTIAVVYRTLQGRGVVLSDGRRGTQVAPRRAGMIPRPLELPSGTIDLENGNPDPDLLPKLDQVLRSIDPAPRLYGGPLNDPDLVEVVRKDFEQDGVAGDLISVTYGALDAIDRVLSETARCGDRVGVEDPGYGNIFDILAARKLQPIPIATDQFGVTAEGVAAAIEKGVRAIIVSPRASNPTGSSCCPQRQREVRAVLKRTPELLVIENDHAAYIADAPFHSIVPPGQKAWVVIRSLSKALNPDFRIAVMTGETELLRRIEDRLVVSERWVSNLIQRMVAALLTDKKVRRHLGSASTIYSERRERLRQELKKHGIASTGSSGFNVWVPVVDESSVICSLMTRGWAVRAGARHRIASGPGVRITAATLTATQAASFAEDFGAIVNGRGARSSA